MIVVTGATGKLGRLVAEGLLRKVPAKEIAVAVRNPEKASDFAARGITVRRADYDKPETLVPALQGAEKLLLISASEVGKRAPQHKAVIEAAKKAGVKLIAYTSIAKADSARMSLASEHKATEEMIRASGIPYVFLRNGWYVENYTENLAQAFQMGALFGAAGQGRISATTRKDYADAAVAVLTGSGHENKSYELGADSAFTMSELASEVSRISGKPVAYKDLPEDDYEGALEKAGLPPPIAQMLASSDAGISRGELEVKSGDLKRLIGRPTTPLAESIGAAVRR